jgi:molybdopterin-guanine dinucleotide biosynthesis protein A
MDMKGSPIPVAAVYTQSAGVVFRQSILTGDFSLQKALRFIDFIPVAAHDARECMNINTPEDFRLISEL